MALEMEKAALGVDPRIKRTQGCGITSVAGSTALANSHGAALEYADSPISMFVTALAEDAGGKQQGWGEGGTWRHLSDLRDPAAVGAKAGRKALERLGPRKVPTQKVPVILHPDIAANWIQGFFNALGSVFASAGQSRRFLHASILIALAAPGSINLIRKQLMKKAL